MNKESLTKMFSKENGNKKNIENAIFLIAILIITVVCINFFWKDSSEKTVEIVSEAIENNTESVIADEDLEKKIKNALTKVIGIGKVEVVLTYKKTSKLVPIFNEEYRESTTDEQDSSRRY